MRRRQNASILHMILQIPKLRQTNTRNIDNVRRVRNGNLRIGSFKARDERQHKVEQVVIQGEERQHLCWRLQLLVGRQAVLISRSCFLILADGFGIEVLDHEEVDGYAALIAMSGPLGILHLGQKTFRSQVLGVLPCAGLAHTAQRQSFHIARRRGSLSATSRCR
jgi:hypothetical protein